LDWKNNARETKWNSKAEVASFVGKGFWSVEMRIPVVDEQEGEIVELGGNGVVGRPPTNMLPWYMNLFRQRIRDNEKESSAYSPTGKGAFNEPSKFARMSPGK
jgi:hypothetical protein